MPLLLLLLLAFAGATPSPAAMKALRVGHMIDSAGNAVPNAVILDEGERIQSAGAGIAIPAGAEVIDLSRYTAIPGLIDAHTHMTYTLEAGRITVAGQPAAAVTLAEPNARRTLEAGVTTVRNLGATGYSDIAMRDLIQQGRITGPRMFVSAHGLFITRAAPRPGVAPGPGQADGPTEVMRVVRQQIAAGADCVKLFGSTGSGPDVSGFQTFTFGEMKAAVDAAHALGKRIAIHSYGPEGGRDAVRAGADSLEHAVDLDDETLAEMARRGTFYVPTIDHNRYYADNAAALNFPLDSVTRLRDFVARNLETARRAFRAGVRFAMGSDAVYTMFGENTRELEWFVKAGMTPAQALATATTNGAALLGMEKSLGAIAPGYYADIVAVEGDPLADIKVVTEKVRWVMKGGTVVVDKPRR